MIDEKDDFNVYIITNKANGKVYIGVTKCSLRKRWNEHICAANKGTKKTFISRAISKYGKDMFTMELFKKCDTESEMYATEIMLITKYNSNDRSNGYNNSVGGEISSKGMRHSPETRAKISATQSNKKRQPHSIQAKESMRLAALGRDMSKAVAASVLKRRGVPLSKETRNKLSAIKIGKRWVPVDAINSDGVIIGTFVNLSVAASSMGTSQPAISNVLTKRAKTAGGYLWQYHQAI